MYSAARHGGADRRLVDPASPENPTTWQAGAAQTMEQALDALEREVNRKQRKKERDAA